MDLDQMKFRLKSQIAHERGLAIVPSILNSVMSESQRISLEILDEVIFHVTRKPLLSDPTCDVSMVSMRRIFEALDNDHDEKLSKLEVLQNIQKPSVVRMIKQTNTQKH